MTTFTLHKPDAKGAQEYEEDYRQGHIPGSTHLPKEQWGTGRGLSQEKTNILCCYSQPYHLAAKAGSFDEKPCLAVQNQKCLG